MLSYKQFEKKVIDFFTDVFKMRNDRFDVEICTQNIEENEITILYLNIKDVLHAYNMSKQKTIDTNDAYRIALLNLNEFYLIYKKKNNITYFMSILERYTKNILVTVNDIVSKMQSCSYYINNTELSLFAQPELPHKNKLDEELFIYEIKDIDMKLYIKYKIMHNDETIETDFLTKKIAEQNLITAEAISEGINNYTKNTFNIQHMNYYTKEEAKKISKDRSYICYTDSELMNIYNVHIDYKKHSVLPVPPIFYTNTVLNYLKNIAKENDFYIISTNSFNTFMLIVKTPDADYKYKKLITYYKVFCETDFRQKNMYPFGCHIYEYNYKENKFSIIENNW